MTELKQKTTEFYEHYKTKVKSQVSQEAGQQFILIPEGEALSHKLQKMVGDAQKSICLMLSQKKLLPWLLNDENLGQALERGITVKVLTESSSRLATLKDIAELQRKHSLEIRYTKSPLSVDFRIYDGKEVMLTTVATMDAKEPASVWSNNTSFLELVQAYFDHEWFSAIEPLEQEFKHDRRQFDYLFANMKSGFSYNRIIFSPSWQPEDFIIIEANDAFLSMFNIDKKRLGNKATVLIPDLEKGSSLMRTFCKIALSEEAKVEYCFQIHGRWYSFIAYCPEKGYFVLMSEDITERKKADDQLRTAEAKYRQLFNSMPSGAAVYKAVDMGADFIFVDFNQTAAKIEGRSKEDLLGKCVTQVFHGVKELGLLNVLQRVFQTGQPEYLPARVYSDNEKLSWRENWVYKLSNGNVVAVYNDVTERKKNEEALRESEERFRVMADGSPLIMWIGDNQGKTVFVNKACLEFFGVSLAEVTGDKWQIVVHPEDAKNYLEAYERSIEEHKPFTARTRVRRADGEWRWIDSHGVPRFAPGGEFLGQIGVSMDITEAVQAEKEQNIVIEFLNIVNKTSDTRELIRAVTDFFQKQSGCEAVGVRLRDGDDYPYYETRGFPPMHVLLENQLCARDVDGSLLRDFKGDPVIECMCGNVICGRFDPSKKFFTQKGSFWANDTTRLLSTTTDADRQTKTRNRCNGEGYESVALIPLCIGTRHLGLLQLNDKRKNMFTLETIHLWERLADYMSLALSRSISEEELHASIANYRELINGMNDSIWVIDFNHKFIDVNNCAVGLYGYSREELLSMSVFDIDKNLSPQDIIGRHAQTVSEPHKVFETIHTAKDGRSFPVEINLTIVTYGGKQAILSVTREITERKKLTADLLEKMQLNQALLDAFPCVALLLRPGTREIIASNKRAVEVGALPGTTCYATWGKRESPCPWCLAPKVWETKEARHLEFEALGVVWDAYWIPVGEGLYMHFAFDKTPKK